MKHADELVKRVLFLEGLPNLQDLGKLRIGETVEEMLRCDLSLEMDAIPDLKVAIAYAESVQDYISRDLFRDPGRRGGARGLAGDPARSHRSHRAGELSAVPAASRRILNSYGMKND